jgi:hypothetical protein
MAGSINDFRANFINDLARPSRFDVQIIRASSFMTFSCETAELPGKTLVTHDQRIYGTIEKFPYQHSYNDINLTFIVSENMQEKQFFDDWLMSVGSHSNNFNFNYKDNYVSDVVITQYDQSNNPSYIVNLIDAYPIAVNQLDLDWSSDGHHKLTVVLAYTYWTTGSSARRPGIPLAVSSFKPPLIAPFKIDIPDVPPKI